MPITKRLRIFAGPNGSGKSTFIKRVSSNPPSPGFKLGYYVNADDIEKELLETHSIDIKRFGLELTTKTLQSYFKKSTFSPIKLNNPELWRNFEINNHKIHVIGKLTFNSYIAADMAEFLRRQLLKNGCSFSYETVMSDKKKISFLRLAKKQGYKIYLYYFATEDPIINVQRIKVRVFQNGHNVKEDIVRKRYYKSLENLKSAIKASDRAFLFDTSQQTSVIIAEVTEGKKVNLVDKLNVPNWFINYLT